ncbi:MAG: hypothetical protein E7248_11745 [Paenibacillaceae bacterium]|nr:hypothetical protein [Paenibacillaceae bacterium]MBE5983957.1 hypothetical protein [Paenibacillaceae bacterium]
MNYTINRFKFWRYLQGNFLYGDHWVRLRKSIKILISVANGALVLLVLYALFGETVIPTLKECIVDMLNYGK